MVASSLLFADVIARDGHKVVFVTSDKQPYNVALAEAEKRSNYTAYHFWKCNCLHCGKTIDVKKATKVTCSCGHPRCENCVIVNCTNSLGIDLEVI